NQESMDAPSVRWGIYKGRSHALMNKKVKSLSFPQCKMGNNERPHALQMNRRKQSRIKAGLDGVHKETQ
ncbi:hypothetical protein KI387_028379, partial [Taxus chinensis]